MKSGTVTRIAALAAALLAGTSAARAAITAPVKTAGGLVSGTPGAQPGVTVFKGIPFAAAPVGALRFREAQPAKPWSGVRDGSRWGDTCIQPKGHGRVNLATDLPDSPKMSEDCLNLNVWTAAARAGEKRPVMVWFYGGAYAEGGGSMPISYGDNLAKKGVVVVTLNYRVGALGFLSHPELTAESAHKASGNQALSDGIAALEWVKKNIAQFGGDPNNVTIFGQSAGACITAALVGSPAAKGLFQRAISESGAWAGLTAAKMVTRDAAEKQTLASADKLGAKSLADLRAMPAEKLAAIRAQGIIVDGWIAPEDFSQTFAAGRQNKVDVLVGSNHDEGSFTAAMAPPGAPPMTAARWKETAPQRWGSLAELGLAAYPAATDEQAVANSSLPFTDGIAWFMRLYADQQAKTGKASYVYLFSRNPPYEPGKKSMGASHASEIAYVFDNLALPHEFPDASSPELASKSPPDRQLADRMSSYWVNFARTGNPNGPGLPQWPRVDQLAPTETFVLDAPSPARGPGVLTEPKLALYKALYERDVIGH